MVSELLAEYNLSLSDVNKQTTSDITELSFDSGKKVYKSWQGTVWGAIARLYFCQVVISKRETVNFIVLGENHNINVVTDVAPSIIKFIENEHKQAKKLHDGLDSHSFYTGAAVRLSQRVRAYIDGLKNNTGTTEAGTALVLVSNLHQKSQQAIEVFCKTRFGKLGKTRSRACNSGSSYALGQSVGDKVSLNKQVTSGNKALLG